MKTSSVNLIEGTFEKEKAGKLLFDLIAFKINYHKNKKFSNEERFGVDQEQSAQRIAQLQAEELKLKNWLQQLNNSQTIQINGNLYLEVIE
jgi:hypothetical protein